MKTRNSHGALWQVAYVVVPPFHRIMEALRLHKGRQPWIVGSLKSKDSIEDVRKYLFTRGFEPAILAWRDDNQVISMRRIHNKIFQYHVRVHDDGEVRAHYEYASEAKPIDHILGKDMEPRKEFFISLLKKHLK